MSCHYCGKFPFLPANHGSSQRLQGIYRLTWKGNGPRPAIRDPLRSWSTVSNRCRQDHLRMSCKPQWLSIRSQVSTHVSFLFQMDSLQGCEPHEYVCSWSAHFAPFQRAQSYLRATYNPYHSDEVSHCLLYGTAEWPYQRIHWTCRKSLDFLRKRQHRNRHSNSQRK